MAAGMAGDADQYAAMAAAAAAAGLQASDVGLPAPAAAAPVDGQPGTVKAWMENRGMGFIAPADGSADVFVHRSNLVDGNSLVVGAQVVFEAGFDAQKGKAIAIKCAGAIQNPNAPGGAGAPVTGVQGGNPTALPGGQPGTVKAWMEDRGMGFIAPADGSADVFVHRSCLQDGSYLVVGASVIFEAGWDQQKNKAIASKVTGAIGGMPGSQGMMMGGGSAGMMGGGAGMMNGTVKAWMEQRGMGFIAPADGSPDYFVHRSNLMDGQSLIVGSQVMFEPSLDQQKQKPIAKSVTGAVGGMPNQGMGGCGGMMGGCGGMDGGMGGCGGMMGGCGGMDGGMGGCGGMMGGGPTETASGTFKVWFADKGFGFITLDNGMGDAFVGSSALPQGMMPSEGMHVSFTCQWNQAKGKYTAVQVMAGGGCGGCGGYGKGYGKGGKGGGGFSPYGNGGGAFNQGGGAPGMQTTGTVKAWMEQRGMGFIAPADGGQDLFVHRSCLTDGGALVVGAQVTFTAEWDQQKGKAIATNVQGAVPQTSFPGGAGN